MRLGLANDPDLARGAGDDLRDSLISLHEPAHADGATAISHLGPSERCTVLDPNQNRESIRVGVVDAQVQESAIATAITPRTVIRLKTASVLWWVTPTIGLLLPFLNLDR